MPTVQLPRPTPTNLLESVYQGFDVLERAFNSELVEELGELPTPEPWVLVAGAGGPSFLNGWGNHASPPTTAFRKNPTSQVELRGRLTNAGGGSTGNLTIAFQLPPGYRPSTLRRLTCSAQDSGGLNRRVAEAKIDTNGDVTLAVGDLAAFVGVNSFYLEGVFSTI